MLTPITPGFDECGASAYGYGAAPIYHNAGSNQAQQPLAGYPYLPIPPAPPAQHFYTYPAPSVYNGYVVPPLNHLSSPGVSAMSNLGFSQGPNPPENKDLATYQLVTSDCDVEQFKNALGKYECPTCGQAYKYFKHLKRHNVKHSGDRPHVCKLCGDSFCRSDIMRRHEKRCMLKLRTTGTCSVISRVPKKTIPEYRIIPELPQLAIQHARRRRRLREEKKFGGSYPGAGRGLMIKHPESPESPDNTPTKEVFNSSPMDSKDSGSIEALSPAYKLSPDPSAANAYSGSIPAGSYHPNRMANNLRPLGQVLTPPPSFDSPVQMANQYGAGYSQMSLSQAAAAATAVGAVQGQSSVFQAPSTNFQTSYVPEHQHQHQLQPHHYIQTGLYGNGRIAEVDH